MLQNAPDQLDPDQDVPDQLVPDHDVPDHDALDQEVPDQLVPDHDVPDQEVPDQLVPDHEVPDHDVPDQMPPDQLVPDQFPPDQLVPLGVVTPLLEPLSAGVQVCVGAFDASLRLRATSLGWILPLPSIWLAVSLRSTASAMNRYLTSSGVNDGSRDRIAAAKPLTTAADCEVPDPRKYRSSTRAVGYS